MSDAQVDRNDDGRDGRKDDEDFQMVLGDESCMFLPMDCDPGMADVGLKCCCCHG